MLTPTQRDFAKPIWENVLVSLVGPHCFVYVERDTGDELAYHVGIDLPRHGRAWIRLAPPEHIVKSGHADGYICFLAGQLHQAALTMVAFDRRKTFAALIEAWAGFNDATIEWWQKGSVPFEAREEGPFNAA